MRRSLAPALAILLGVSGGALFAGCGSGTKTVSVPGTPAVASTASTATNPPSTTSSTTTPSSSTGSQTTNGGTPATPTTRTAPEPAFVQKPASAEGLAAATAVLRAQGYAPVETSAYHPNQTLRVLIGRRTGSTDGYGQQAFFFVDGRYIGTDSKQPSATVAVANQGDTEVTLVYPLYRSGDPLSSPSGGQARVRFQLNNGKLVALDPIPPASSQSGTSRQ
jgi:LppP/LprE lipoprotein